MPVERINPDTMRKSSAFTQMVVFSVGSRIVMIGGQNAVDQDGNLVGQDDLAKQTEQALKNLVTCLEAVGASVADLIQVKIYILAGQNLRAAFGAWMNVWGERVDPPTVTAIFVSGLANPGYLIEIEATAVLAD